MSKDGGSRKELEVFNFADEGESELISKKYLQKFCRSKSEEFRSPKPDTTPLSKYQCLKTFSSKAGSQGKKMSFITCVDVETSESNHKCKDRGAIALSTSNRTDCAIKMATSLTDDIPSNSICERETDHSSPAGDEGGITLPGCVSVSSFEAPCCNANSLAMETLNLEAPSSGNNNKVDVLSDDDESATCSSDVREGSLEDSASDHDSDGWEMGYPNMVAVVVRPDYLIYKDLYCTDSLLSFGHSCVKLEGVYAYGSKESFSYEWEIIDVIGIESQWFARVETAIVKLHIRPDADLEGAVPGGPSGAVELKFAVPNPPWLEDQEKIMSMDARYKAIWTSLIHTDANEEVSFVGRSRRKHYFPTFDEPFEDVIYPKGDPDAVSISKRDVELLQPETFINDTIIDFYIKYLKNNISPEKRNRFHFFNSFFFRKLADLDKNPSSASEGRAAFLRVRKWTRKVNLFEKDYILIPVNFNLHWSLIVICHPGEVASFKDEDVVKSLKVPCILHMDSIKGSHKGLRNLVQSYLWEEWKERHPESSEDVSLKFFNLRFVPLELPQQENSFDCGLFLLHYVELFLEEAPASFNPFKLAGSSNFLHLAWFSPSEASLKRTLIQKLIYELLKDYYQENHPPAQDKKCEAFPYMDNHIKKENGVGFFGEQHIAGSSCHDLLACSNDQGIEMELLGNPGASQFVPNSGMVLELFQAGTTVGSFSNGQCESLDHLSSFNKFDDITMPTKEDREIGKLFPLSPVDRVQCQSLDAYSVGDACTNSSLIKSFEICDPVEDSRFIAGQDRDHQDEYISCEPSICGSQSSSEVMIDESLPVNRQEEKETPNNNILSLCTAENSDSGCSEEGMDTRIVEDSQEVDRVVDDNEKQGSLSHFEENVSASDHWEASVVENLNQVTSGPGSSDDIVAPDTVERAAKRARLTLPVE